MRVRVRIRVRVRLRVRARVRPRDDAPRDDRVDARLVHLAASGRSPVAMRALMHRRAAVALALPAPAAPAAALAAAALAADLTAACGEELACLGLALGLGFGLVRVRVRVRVRARVRVRVRVRNVPNCGWSCASSAAGGGVSPGSNAVECFCHGWGWG